MCQTDPFQIASDFIKYTNRSVFLTGKAGTGKTTFLKHYKENPVKNTAVVAPTGIAAINAGGITIHSFFQLPFNPFIPTTKAFENSDGVNDRNSLIRKLRISKERKEVLQKLELLIIDEISMVRCDLLDSIDTVLRHIREKHSLPFGGVQVLLIGDMHQLPPVIREEEWQLISAYYQSPYFFSSHVIQSKAPVYIELNKIFRQNDEKFVRILNQVRNNDMNEASYEQLHERYLPGFHPPKTENYITLTTHNNKADAINFKALNELKGEVKLYEAEVEGEFYESSFPAEEMLKLKEGAQVIFIKNDSEKAKRYFNGKIGVVVNMEDEMILVRCNGEEKNIEVKMEKWKNIRYSVNNTTKLMEEIEIGSFTQFPLRLAWAITIHKSQGLTFEKAIIDVGEAFAPGQIYVALSRCRNLEGIILHSRVPSNRLQNDSRILGFAQIQQNSQSQVDQLYQAKYTFQKNEIITLFDFKGIQLNTSAFRAFMSSQVTIFGENTLTVIQEVCSNIDKIVAVTQKFQPQLIHILENAALPEENELLQKRIMAASKHFNYELSHILEQLTNLGVGTDSKAVAKQVDKLLAELYGSISLRVHLLGVCENGFKAEFYLHHKRTYVEPPFIPKAYGGALAEERRKLEYPELFQLLRIKRNEIAEERNCPLYLIAGNNSLEELAEFRPEEFEELCRIKGFGPVKSKQFGECFIDIIREFNVKHQLTSNMGAIVTIPKPYRKNTEIKTDTKTISFNLYTEGRTITEIAAERNLAFSTIESHISYFVGIGEIDINSFLNISKQDIIRSAVEKYGDISHKLLKEKLPADISYGEIKMMIEFMKIK